MRVGVWVLAVSLLSMFFVCFLEVVNESGSCCDRFSGFCCKFVYQLSNVMRCV